MLAYTCVLVGRPSFFLAPQGWATTPRTAWTSRPPAGEGEVPPLEEVDPWKLLDLMDIGCLEMGWSWGVCLLFCFFWIFFVQVIWHRSAWGDFLWVFLGDFWMLKICKAWMFWADDVLFPLIHPLFWLSENDGKTQPPIPMVHHGPWSYESPNFQRHPNIILLIIYLIISQKTVLYPCLSMFFYFFYV